jgi:hypothetical protein
MNLRVRRVEPEMLDDLSPDDPRARRSRRDLQRVHQAMGSVSIMKKAFARLRLVRAPRSIVELGAGDATLLLRFASQNPKWRDVQLTLLDRYDVVAPRTLRDYSELGWKVTVLCQDALAWARDPQPPADLCIASLFLHHFDEGRLKLLLEGIKSRSRAFIASEPRRGRLAGVGSRLIGALGAGPVTRSDAVTSVAAGFRDQEISAAWPQDGERWWLDEFDAKPFSHCFVAAHTAVRARPA